MRRSLPLKVKTPFCEGCKVAGCKVASCVFRAFERFYKNATRNPQLSKKSILEYVMRLHSLHVREEWKEKYQALWEEIIELPAVSATIYNKGKQQGTTFNRNLVANILHLMAEKKVLTTDNATKLAMTLEGTSDTSVRAKLGELPPREIELAVGVLMK